MPGGTLVSIITPIYKNGGDKTHSANYRPVPLTNHMVKIFEMVFRVALVGHFFVNGHLNRTQHGFKIGHSIMT